MPYIEIIEKDETTPGPVAEQTDVVYIPGLVDITQRCLFNKDGEYVGIKANTPTLFTSVKQFESLCGKRPATFTVDQYYSDLQEITSTGDIVGFSDDAIPFSKRMFYAGDIDPSYVIAKECLSSGLNVLYERINGETLMEQVTYKPSDWDSNYISYYTDKEEEVPLKNLGFNSAPLWYREANASELALDDDGNRISTEPLYVIVKKSGSNNVFQFEDYVSTNTDHKTSIKYVRVPDSNYTLIFGYEIIDLPQSEDELTTFVNEYYNVTTDWEYQNKDGEVVTLELESGITKEQFKSQIVALVEGGIDKIRYERSDSTRKDITVDTNGKMLHITEANINYGINWADDFNKAVLMTTVKKSCEGNEFNTDSTAIVYKPNDGLNIKSVYKALEAIYDSGNEAGLIDKGNYSIKYLTSGGYPVYEYKRNDITNKMLALAEKRGDCVAFIDHTNYADREADINHAGSVYNKVKSDETFLANGEFGTMFTPWAEYNRDTIDKDDQNTIIKSKKPMCLPGSYAYLMALADSIKTNANWLAIAGAARGVVPNLATDGMLTVIPNGTADNMQPRDGIAVNAITNIKPYGWTIWGNRTLKKNTENLTATSFLNIRNLVSDVKKTTYRVARKLTFEQNNDILWVNFKGLISPTLDRMLTGYGISGYKIVRDTQHEKASEKATICAKIILYPVYAVEDFYITVVLRDDEITVE